MSTTTIETIIERLESLADAREALAAYYGALNAEIDRLTQDAMPRIRVLSAAAAEKWAELEAAIDGNRNLFFEPRSITRRGIKAGLEKGKGAIEIADEDKTLRLIRKLLPEQADVLIDTIEKPSKKALGQLQAADLKRLGCNVKDAGDVVIIRPANSALDRVVQALIKSHVDQQRQAAEAAS